MTFAAMLFWIAFAVVCYTYAGYAVLLRAAVALRERLCPRTPPADPDPWPEVTLLIAAYNEQEVVDAKMRNSLAQDYPGELRIVWITDGSDDGTVAELSAWPEAAVLHRPERRGKTAALNRAFPLLETSVVVCTDANTMLNPGAVRAMVRLFSDPAVGCVAGEKRVAADEGRDAAATEGLYWKYESKLKEWDDRLSSACGAAGELFAVRRELYRPVEEDTLLDDFVISMRIAADGRRIAYCKEAYALEPPSADIREEGKRKRRIAAGGLQAVWRLRGLTNPFRYGVFAWQYLSHRVLRWTLAPLLLVALLPLNVWLAAGTGSVFYAVLLLLQGVFYAAALTGWVLSRRGMRNPLLFVPYYFLFMNLNVFRGLHYLATHRGRGTWEKARRAA